MPDLITTAEQLAGARAAHAVAIKNHTEAVARAGRSTDLHRIATGQRQAMLDRAAGGERVTEMDLARANVAATEALDTADLLRSIVIGSLAKVHEREIQVLHAQVADHSARSQAARAAACTAAELVDQAVAAARARLADFLDCLGDLRALHQEASQHNAHTLRQAIAANKVLAGLHSSMLPKFADVPVSRSVLAVQVVADTGHGLTGGLTRVVHSVAQYAAVLAPVAPAPTAVQATQAA